MVIADAIAEIKAYRDRHGYSGTLEAVTAMRDDDLLTPRERAAFNVFMGDMQRLVG